MQKLHDTEVPKETLQNIDQLWTPLYTPVANRCTKMWHGRNRGWLPTGYPAPLKSIRCVHLVRLDVRQESTRHSDVLSELTRYLGIGDYDQWASKTRLLS
ncbi:phosphoenolpyruvate carboxylase [Vibrio chagasii]|nr:phosphoenolpyruvate carboxylase [Vibrio chagasii]